MIINPCAKCKRPMELKCCHNCKKDASKCDVWHICGQDCKEWEKQIPTNADRIRSMSDEELRNWLFQRDCTNIAAFLEHGGMGVMNAVQLLEWLQQPSEGE